MYISFILLMYFTGAVVTYESISTGDIKQLNKRGILASRRLHVKPNVTVLLMTNITDTLV